MKFWNLVPTASATFGRKLIVRRCVLYFCGDKNTVLLSLKVSAFPSRPACMTKSYERLQAANIKS